MKRQSVMSVSVLEVASPASDKTLLMRQLAAVKDPRKPRGRRFSMVSLLMVALCATAAGSGRTGRWRSGRRPPGRRSGPGWGGGLMARSAWSGPQARTRYSG